MRLQPNDVKSTEVFGWQGLHLFHAHASSCSQKVRMVMNWKGIGYTSHPIDISANENISAFYLGINPRGLVPTLVHDGDVHIESNDIITLLEEFYPDKPLIPADMADQISELLRHEDDLHLDLRTLSFRFLLAPTEPPKSAEDLERYATLGSGTVGGEADDHLAVEIAFWRSFAESGISDEAARVSAARFRKAFDGLDARLADQPYFLGTELSVLDIAWLVYVHRLRLSGYPIERLHPNLARWTDELSQHEAFRNELALPPHILEHVAQRREALVRGKGTMIDICDLG